MHILGTRPLILIKPSAQLKGVTGSIANREKIAEQKQAQLCEFLQNQFSQGNLTKQTLLNFYKKNFPGINIKITTKSKKNPSFSEDFTFNLKQRKGYILNIPYFSKNSGIEKGESIKIGAIHHEHEHLLRTLTEPKYSTFIILKRINNLNKKLDLISFYSKIIYTPRPINKEMIEKFFEQNKFTQKEKIVTLHIWQSQLKDEQKAFKIDAISEMNNKYPLSEIIERLKKEEPLKFIEQFKTKNGLQVEVYDSEVHHETKWKISELNRFVKNVQDLKQNEYSHIFDFKNKIDLIQKMLLDEIAKVRADHKQGNFGGEASLLTKIKSVFQNISLW